MHRTLFIAIAGLLLPVGGQYAHAQFFVETSANELYREDGNSFQEIGTLSVPTTTVGGHNSGLLYGISDASDLLHVSVANAQATTIGPLGNDIQTLAFVNGATTGPVSFALSHQDLYTIDLSTGAPTLVGEMGNFATSGYVSAVFDNYDTLYLTEQNGAADSSLYTVNTQTGLATLIGPIGFAVTAVVGNDGGSLFGFTTAGQVISISGATGAGTLQFNETGINGIVVGASSSAIPEPSTLVLAALGGLALLAWRRSK